MKNIIKIMLIILLSIMFIANLVKLNLYLALGSILLFLITYGIFYLLYKKKLITIKFIKIFSIILIIIGIVIRIYLLFNLKYTLKSDFLLYFNTALEIFKKVDISEANYLAYNGYVCVYASILALLFKIFGASVQVVIIFHLICELLTMFIIYKIIKLINNTYLKYLLPSIWFIMPTVIEANFLVSTETLFILLFSLCIYVYFKLNAKNKINITNIILFILYGMLLSFTNYIRPLMLIFIIAIIITYLFNFEKKKLLFLVVLIGSFLLTNLGFKSYCENLIKVPSQSGALEWGLYYGSNYDTSGYWNVEDSLKIDNILLKENPSNILLKETIKRYKDLGIWKTSILFAKKYYCLWTDVNGNYIFLLDVTNNDILVKTQKYLEISSYFIFINLLCYTIYCKIKEIKLKDYKLLIVDIFIIIYVISNILMVVNGRYNYPIYILLLILICNTRKTYLKSECKKV